MDVHGLEFYGMFKQNTVDGRHPIEVVVYKLVNVLRRQDVLVSLRTSVTFFLEIDTAMV